jgi:hypothetical protein
MGCPALHRKGVARTLIIRTLPLPQELAPFQSGEFCWLPRRLRAFPSAGLDEFQRSLGICHHCVKKICMFFYIRIKFHQ